MSWLVSFVSMITTFLLYTGLTSGQGYGGYGSSFAQSCSTACSVSYPPVNASDCFMLLIDYQSGTLYFVRNVPRAQVLGNMKYLALLAKILNIPTVMTTSLEDQFDGPVVTDLQQILPDSYASRIPRHGTINPWEEPAFKAAAIKAAGGRKTAIIAGLTNDVCVVNPAISIKQDGFNVIAVQDASGSPNAQADENARRRWEMAGVRTFTTTALLTEMAHDWNNPDGAKVLQQLVIDQYLPSFNTTYPFQAGIN
ncbi:probable hydrolase YcaC [Paramacrobiotus metropolitanus]|uniref:probable hydrolase YcaC n=1 Tax=Paramacrobiotus metropolitanus TaxID=2943436 RepID=UPI002445D97A|nr:probable hydrolase YcaC [Paramacrobiotus metropolitanus]